jgi:hypothetical protein
MPPMLFWVNLATCFPVTLQPDSMRSGGPGLREAHASRQPDVDGLGRIDVPCFRGRGSLLFRFGDQFLEPRIAAQWIEIRIEP